MFGPVLQEYSFCTNTSIVANPDFHDVCPASLCALGDKTTVVPIDPVEPLQSSGYLCRLVVVVVVVVVV